jgi:hypothetical protein
MKQLQMVVQVLLHHILAQQYLVLAAVAVVLGNQVSQTV